MKSLSIDITFKYQPKTLSSEKLAYEIFYLLSVCGPDTISLQK